MENNEDVLATLRDVEQQGGPFFENATAETESGPPAVKQLKDIDQAKVNDFLKIDNGEINLEAEAENDKKTDTVNYVRERVMDMDRDVKEILTPDAYMPSTIHEKQVLPDMTREKHIQPAKQMSTLNTHNHFKLIWDEQIFKTEVKHCFNDCTSKFITMPRPRGLMANQMFQIASIIGVAYDHDIMPVISTRFTEKVAYFKLPNLLDMNVTNLNRCVEKGFAVFTKCEEQMFGNVSFIGYRQSWRYFENVTNIVRNVFRFRPLFMEPVTAYMNSVRALIEPYYKVVGIHVRRGDITDEVRLNYYGLPVVGDGYFKKAMGYFTNIFTYITFVVISDDIEWCKDNIKGPNIIYSPFEDRGSDMALMTICDYMILTYGTYGWWGAWLSGKPAVYFWEDPLPGGRSEEGLSQFDYYPHTWIPMSN